MMDALIDLETYIKLFSHDNRNTNMAIECLVKRGNKEKALDYLAHQKYITDALGQLTRFHQADPPTFSVRPAELLRIAQSRLETEQISKDKGIYFSSSIDKDLEVVTNGPLAYRYIFNILDNAIKAARKNDEYGLAKGRIHISNYNGGSTDTISIKDNGPGIRKDDIVKITRPEYTTGGTGFGLAFLDIVSDRINLEYEVRSEPQKGTEFLLKFNKY